MRTPVMETDRLILREVQQNDTRDISYNLGDNYWGRGYTTEA